MPLHVIISRSPEQMKALNEMIASSKGACTTVTITAHEESIDDGRPIVVPPSEDELTCKACGYMGKTRKGIKMHLIRKKHQ